MAGLIVGIVIVVVLGLILLTLTLHIVQQYEKGVVFRFGRDRAVRRQAAQRVVFVS